MRRLRGGGTGTVGIAYGIDGFALLVDKSRKDFTFLQT